MEGRPRAVSAVIGVLLALASVALASAAAEVLTYSELADRLTRFQQAVTQQGSQVGLDVEFPHLPTVAIGPTVMVVAVLVAIAAGLVALALSLRLPKPRARMMALAAAGTLAGLAIARAVIALTNQLALNQIFAESQEIRKNLSTQYSHVGSLFPGIEDLFPSWPYNIDYLTSALTVIGCAAVIILLTQSQSRTWFARPEVGASLPSPEPAADVRDSTATTHVVDTPRTPATPARSQTPPRPQPTWQNSPPSSPRPTWQTPE